MLANAMCIREARFGYLLLRDDDGESFHAVYLHDVPPSYREVLEPGSVRPDPSTGLGRVVRTKQVVHIPDLMADPTYAVYKRKTRGRGLDYSYRGRDSRSRVHHTMLNQRARRHHSHRNGAEGCHEI